MLTPSVKKLSLIVGLLSITLVLLFGCTESLSTSSLRRIKQSNKVFEDNVNGRKSQISPIEESTNFFYNTQGLLSSVTVYDDTSINATLLKSITFEYASDKITAYTYYNIDGPRTLYFYFDNNKKLTALTDSLGRGLYLSYNGNQLTRIRDSSEINILDLINFTYDTNNNLLSYELSVDNGPVIGRAILEYSDREISEELDTRFFSKDIKFIYLGGLNLVYKIGLNFGTNNKNTLIKRTEINVIENKINAYYEFTYTYNNNGEIIKRAMLWDTDTLFYQFRY
jgi:hypothetical protein